MTRRPEQQLQRAVLAHLRWRARPGVWWCHIPNGGARSKIEAAILRGLGVTPGAPDLLFLVDGQAYFLELKAPGGRVSATQHECHEALRNAGAAGAVVYNIDEALALLEGWAVLRPNLSTQTAKAFQQLRHDVAMRAARVSPPHGRAP